MEAPKLFISYSWSSPIHEQWVLDLASELRESGVDVILDKWDLKEGYDAVAFMEKMVTDPEIKKVAIVSDEIYAAKADGRAGGVGTETQIISKEVYENQEQDKFVAVVAQKDEVGKPYLPTYYKSRIYIDLSEPDKYGENFEKLLRWVFDKPLYVKPDLGKKPSFLDKGESISLGTTANFKRAVDAIRNNKAYALGALDEYLNTFAENLERFRIKKSEGEFDDAVVKSIEDFLPHRNEAIQLFVTISQYAANDENIQKMHRFFESLVPYMNRPEHVRQWNEWDFDNFIFIVHELFLYAVAVLIKHERFDQANFLMEQKYYMPGNSDYGRDIMVSFIVFRKYMRSLEHRNKRLGLRRLSVRADLLKERSSGTGVEFRDLMQADFVLYLRAELEAEGDFGTWWPETLLYLGHFHSPFEIFARAVSNKYFDKVKCLLAIDSPADLEGLMNAYKEDKRRLPRWEFESFSPSALLGYDQLAKRT
jgi:hypothetical protein